MIELVGQIIGILGTVIAVLSFQCKDNKKFFIWQAACGACFAANFMLIGNVTVAFLHFFNIVRAASFGFTKGRARGILAVAVVLMYTASTVLTFEGFSLAGIMAIAALAAKVARLSRGAEALMWLPVALFMMRIAAGRAGRLRRAIGRAAVLLACEGFLGGVVLALYGATGSLPAAHVLSIGCAGAVFVSARRSAAAYGGVQRVRVTCRIGERTLGFDAIMDSGNSLRDYLTHRPVIVAAAAEKSRMGDVRTRLIFADTAGGRQMMQLFIPDSVEIAMEGERIQVLAALAFSPAMRADAPALVPASLLE